MITKHLRNYVLIGFGLFGIVLILQCRNSLVESDYFTPKALATHFNGEVFVGSTTCMECHADIYTSHAETAHHLTSAVASKETIKGSFHKEKNTWELLDAHVTMIENDGSFYERKDFKFGDKTKSESKIDIVIGSGVKGQSYISWEDDKLYQLQTSYLRSTDNWINSPNFSNRSMTRPISDACLKCHVTFAKNTDASGKGNTYENKNFIYGIDCERCHRPSEKHVIYHRTNPDSLQPKFIMLADTLSRQQSLDNCAQCHSGLRSQQVKGGPFSFMAGENLELYSRNYYFNRPGAKLDVHGNQYGLLTSSKCFKESPKMDCITCHNPHKNQRGDTAYFNNKCISCHETLISQCTAPESETNAMANNCITCHMPLSPSETMKVKLTQDEDEAPIMIRSHLIGVYQNSAQMK